MLSQLRISHLRNISELQFAPCSGINLLVGDNGSGKTSILEAIHLLALGRSFRTRSLKNAVQFKQDMSQVSAKTINDIPVGAQYHINNGLTLRFNSAPVKRLSELASHLPLQFIPANCHQIFEQGPRYRRQLLDWGLFHVEPEFNFHWQSYKKIVQQRNSSLRQRKSTDEIKLWDQQYCVHGEAIKKFRQKLLDRLLIEFSDIFSRICPELAEASYTAIYKTGWLKGLPLQQALEQGFERDKQLTYSKSGSHAADWIIRINDGNPSEVLSRGQQKLYFIALSLAQTKITTLHSYHTSTDGPLMLIDDLSSELDVEHQNLVLKELAKASAQCFITTTDQQMSDRVSDLKHAVFHVKQGAIKPQE